MKKQSLFVILSVLSLSVSAFAADEAKTPAEVKSAPSADVTRTCPKITEAETLGLSLEKTMTPTCYVQIKCVQSVAQGEDGKPFYLATYALKTYLKDTPAVSASVDSYANFESQKEVDSAARYLAKTITDMYRSGTLSKAFTVYTSMACDLVRKNTKDEREQASGILRELITESWDYKP